MSDAEKQFAAFTSSVSRLILNREHRLTIPKFQRSYCWTERELETLWDDVESVLGVGGHNDADRKTFLGAVILDWVEPSSPERPETFEIIDGQQRIVTLFSLVALVTSIAYREAVKAERDESLAEEASSLKRYARNTAQRLLSSAGDEGRPPKVIPSYNDRPEFNRVLECLEFLGKNPAVEKFELVGVDEQGSLKLAMGYLNQKIEGRISNIAKEAENDSEAKASVIEYLGDLLQAVSFRLELIEVKLGASHDANLVFDRLNVQGQELTVLDLVRNEIFAVFGDDDVAAAKFYDGPWRDFEAKLISPVAALFDEEAEGSELEKKRKLTSEHRSNFWLPYALTINPDVSASSKAVFEFLKNHWKTRFLGNSPREKAKGILSDLERFVPAYNVITFGVRPTGWDKNGPLWAAASRIHQYRAPKGSWAYLFRLLEFAGNHKNHESDVVECLKMLESYVVRQACMASDGSVKNVLNPAWRIAQANPDRLLAQLHDKSRPFFESPEVEASLQKEGMNFYRTRIAKFFLTEYERDFQRKIQADVFEPGSVHIDHLIPVKAEHWAVDDADHDAYVNSVGNLVAVSDKINRLKSNHTWEEARRIFSDKSASRVPKAIVENNETWDFKKVQSRSKELAEWCTKYWPKKQYNKKEWQAKFNEMLTQEQNSIDDQVRQEKWRCGYFKKTETVGERSNLTPRSDLVEYLKDSGIHDYSEQETGQKKAVIKPAYFVYESYVEPTTIRFSRIEKPVKGKKKVENRLWPKELNRYCGKWQLMAIGLSKGRIYIVNASNPVHFDYFRKLVKK